MQIESIILSGTLVHLEPLQIKHADDLYKAGQAEQIWRYMPLKLGQSLAEMQDWIVSTLKLQESGTILPFAIIDKESERAIGSTRYLDIQKQHRGLEIGWTWLTPQVQRTGMNTECKYLLLQHAFEHLGAIRVQLKTDSRNQQSQRAIERIGAIKEGILRNHMITWDGYYRHSVYYSIIESEWPTVKASLEEKMVGYKQAQK